MASWRRIIESTLKKSLSNSSLILRKIPLAGFTSYRIGGNAEWLIIINSIKDLKTVLKFISEYDIPFFIIGAGSNLLISDQGLKGITIKLGKSFCYIKVLPNSSKNQVVLKIGASTTLAQIVNYCKNHNMSGAEFLWGIPGTFGGAIKNNAGAFNHDLGEKIVLVFGIDKNGNELSLRRDEIDFNYRKTSIPDDIVITSGCISLYYGNRKEIKNKLSSYTVLRRNTQPHGFSAGCVFKNPLTFPAGKLIEMVGLKGFIYDGAGISSKHANFIVNYKRASMLKIYELIQKIKVKVENYTGIILEEEIEILPKTKEVNKWLDLKKSLV
ncbi:MAG: UDP-N-acetylmuramate dehydrogenase [candidate division WOR-3 bacterium]|nr:UDP-N-acetylmuramate dehydrogenase [candidate division WOR-3 bacterium]MCX7757350.1 UDP-N-acetylmuramate dehydrogenase [candidate division WOR-3 bacterium]MDW7988239.1 UDP-N-acetylmuramate dehydrogenase [candidate division WOR-3 bacterium]